MQADREAVVPSDSEGPHKAGRKLTRTRFLAAIKMTAIAGVCLAQFAQMVFAHEIRPAVVTASFGAGEYRIELQANMEAVLAGVSPQHKDTDESPNARHYDTLRALPADALQRQIAAAAPGLIGALRVEFDGVRVTPELASIEVPPPGDLALSRITRMQLRGPIPPGAQAFRWAYPAEHGSSVLRLKREGDADVVAAWLKDGAASEPFPLAGPVETPSRAQVAWQYTGLGFTHILPYGLDHILFVLGLFLLSARLKPLLWQVTAFTVAHTITLALSIYGVVSLPPAIVEPLIAASIVYVAVENIVTGDLKPWRPLVVFGFGLLHGLGFAGVLSEVGLPRSEFVTGLIAFNVGVELGQLAVIALAFVAVGMWARRAWYRARVVVPASVAIATIGLYWTIERLLG